MNKTGARLLLNSIGVILSVVPVAVTVALYFPVWAERGNGSVISGFAVMLLALGAMPLFKYAKRILSSPSCWMMWLGLLLLFLALSRIADEMVVIALVGFIGNAIGAVLFNIAKRIGDKEK